MFSIISKKSFVLSFNILHPVLNPPTTVLVRSRTPRQDVPSWFFLGEEIGLFFELEENLRPPPHVGAKRSVRGQRAGAGRGWTTHGYCFGILFLKPPRVVCTKFT